MAKGYYETQLRAGVWLDQPDHAINANCCKAAKQGKGREVDCREGHVVEAACCALHASEPSGPLDNLGLALASSCFTRAQWPGIHGRHTGDTPVAKKVVVAVGYSGKPPAAQLDEDAGCGAVRWGCINFILRTGKSGIRTDHSRPVSAFLKYSEPLLTCRDAVGSMLYAPPQGCSSI